MDIKRTGVGPRMTQSVVYNDTIYLSGQVGYGDTVAAQTADMLASVDKLLAAEGSSKSRILSATIWMSDMGQFDEMNAVWDAWIDPANPPARATGEAKLATPDFFVEIIVVAATA